MAVIGNSDGGGGNTNYLCGEGIEYTNPNEVTLLLIICLCSIDECI